MSQTNSSTWVYDIQDKIASRISAICTAKLKVKYPSKYGDLTVTTNSHELATAKFPCVYIQFLAPLEIGKDLVGQDVNAIYLTVQISVIVPTAKKMETAREVTSVVTDAMKEMAFGATLAEFADTDSEYRTISRFTRTIGCGESLYH